MAVGPHSPIVCLDTPLNVNFFIILKCILFEINVNYKPISPEMFNLNSFLDTKFTKSSFGVNLGTAACRWSLSQYTTVQGSSPWIGVDTSTINYVYLRIAIPSNISFFLLII